MIHIIAHALKINFNSEISKYTINSHVWGKVELRKELLQLWDVQGMDMKSHRKHTDMKLKRKGTNHIILEAEELYVYYLSKIPT